MICILCAGSKYKTRSDVLRGGIPRCVVECACCGLISLEDPTEELMDYATEYRRAYNPVLGAALTAQQHYDAMPSDNYIRRTERLLTPSMRVLEVGCATGGYLEAVRDMVKTARGVEPNLEHAAFCVERGLDVMCGNVEDMCGERFDLIAAFQVLEHMPYPLAFLRAIRGLLAQDGQVYFELPNHNEILTGVPAFPAFYYTAAHAYYYTADTLNMLMCRAGFRGRITYAQDYSLYNHVHWFQDGTPQPTTRDGHGIPGPECMQALLRQFDQTYRQELVRLGRAQHLIYEGRAI
jgi:SAM-dependent methyltransferase